MSNTELSPIGGYLELELPPSRAHYHDTALRFNSGRSCLAYLLLRKKIKKIYIPYLSCESILEPLDFHKIQYAFYRIDKNFEIIEHLVLRQDEYLLYINYFGLKTTYITFLINNYLSSLIIDNTQAFFLTFGVNILEFYSPRKFFGVPDGGYLSSDLGNDQTLNDINVHPSEYSHLVGRIEHGAQAHFWDYQRNEDNLSYDGIKRMSHFSERILTSIDYTKVKAIREENFIFLHKALGKYNNLNINIDSISGPLCYPLWVTSNNLRKKMIENLIFVPTYWDEVISRVQNDDFIEISLVKDILPLPIDQRYSYSEMQRIVNLVRKEL